MVTDSHVRHKLHALAENRLAAAERARVEAHLAECAACRAEAAEVWQLVDTLAALPAALRTLPDRTARGWPAVWARVQGSPATARRMAPQLSLYLSLALVAFVLVTRLPHAAMAGSTAVTAGLPATPAVFVLPETPSVGLPEGTDLAESLGPQGLSTTSTAAAARPIPIPTPGPGPGG